MESVRLRNVQAVNAILEVDIDHDHVWEALQMPASDVLAINGRQLHQGHKTLAGLGDRIAETVLFEGAFLSGLASAKIDGMIQRNLCNASFARICDDLGITPLINTNRSHHGPLGEKTKSGAVEALIGAAYLSGGLPLACRVMSVMGLV
ncbi:Hypothetical protein D9617_39g039290 [Elsinoe fawcettii]|nr:Hypothetical protein D9617_39g039290 [Elsinoe fawcettii]